ncbi:hypothetical protein BDY19DRAFT_1035348 [Irpex rosettiformis]|uniref:Uncharacterized protein n=1 Tax=Irpex rosettiformis TaxID=378272 RepID=A0ACB8U975_9APHY|nr:hypothetical protein BDY19DRAFT_1035348 [Irpex rosettiformis]
MDLNVLDNVLASLHSYSLAEALMELLVNSRYENSPHRQVFIAQWPLLLRNLVHHPLLRHSTEHFAFASVTNKLTSEVSCLVDKESGWHISARNAHADQLKNFDIDTMSSRMQEQAPTLSALLGVLLDGSYVRTPGRVQYAESKKTSDDPSVTAAGLESDEEDEYWLETSTEMEELGDNPGGVGGSNSSNARTRAEQLKKRHAMAMKRKVALLAIRRVVIMSIIAFSTNQKCNALAAAMGMFFHSANTPELVVEVFAHAGLSVSTTTIHNMITSLSKSANEEVRKLAKTKVFALAYDNFDMDFKSWSSTIEKPGDTLKHATSALIFPLAHGVAPEDLRHCASLWRTSPLNPGIPHEQKRVTSAWKHLFTPPDADRARQRREILAWHFRNALVTHNKAFEQFQSNLGMPETILQIPVTKTTHIPCRAMDIDQSTVDGQAEILESLFTQANIGDPSDVSGVEDISDYVVLVHGDLGTGERLHGSQDSRSIERTPVRGLRNPLFVMGLFHLQMAAADAIWRMFIKPKSQRTEPNCLYQQACKIRPHDSGRIGSQPGFRLMHDLILQCASARILDVWRVAINKLSHSSLESFADSSSWSDIVELSHDLVKGYLDQPLRGDQEFRNNTLILGRLLDYVELTHAMKHGDIGRVEATFLKWVFIFKSVGKHKYASQLIKTMNDLRFVYPARLARAIRLNWLCNPTGRPDGFRAIDWLVELMNLYIKVVYGSSGYTRTFQLILKQSPLIEVFRHLHRTMQDSFHLPHRSVRHAPQSQENTLQALCALLCANKAYEFEDNRKSYELTDHVHEGIYKLQSSATIVTMAEKSGSEGESVFTDDAEKDDEAEVEIDDLEAE